LNVACEDDGEMEMIIIMLENWRK